MKRILLSLCLLAALSGRAEADRTDLQNVNNQITVLSQSIDALARENQQLKTDVARLRSEVKAMRGQVTALEAKSDSADQAIMSGVTSNTALANNNHAAATEQIQVVESASQSRIHQLTIWGWWAIAVLLIVAIAVYIVLRWRISKGTDAISTIRSAQDDLQAAHKRLEEESAKLDTELLGLIEKQLASISATPAAAAPDHSLVLKMADEVVRIEKNLSRMDPTVKGYKPLTKAIERIKDNFKAYGYEIETYLGQKYNEGMRVNADFVIDETLPEGARVITSVSKPQVHFNGELIQKATVTVSQNI